MALLGPFVRESPGVLYQKPRVVHDARVPSTN